MKAFVTYAVVLASGVALGFGLREPRSFEKFVGPSWLDEVNSFVMEALADAKPKATVAQVDPFATARVDEEPETKSLEGWRSFLAAYENGRQDAKAEIDKLLPVDAAPAKRAADAKQATPIAEASDSGPPLTANAASTNASHASEGMQVASLDFEENCQLRADRLLEVDNSPVEDEAVVSLSPTGCKKFRPEVLRLMDSGLATTAPAAAEPSKVTFGQTATGNDGIANHAEAAQGMLSGSPQGDQTAQDSLASSVPETASASSSPSAKAGSGRLPKHRRDTSSNRTQTSRHASRRRHFPLPLILMALLGEKPMRSGY